MQAPWKDTLASALHSSILGERDLGGSSFHRIVLVTLASGEELFVKVNAAVPSDLFSAEADGLSAMASDVVRVPEVRGFDEAWIAMEYLPSAPRSSDFEERFGRMLGNLHTREVDRCGWHRDNYLATLVQDNKETHDWIEFYGQRRLAAFVEQAVGRGLAPASWRRLIERLCDRLPEFIPSDARISLLHGDLWSGNVHQDREGHPVLIDPAVYVGHAEIDLAMLQLFGSPSLSFFGAYDEVAGCDAGREERVALYQLYPLLAHLLLFGGGYREQCRSIIERYS